MTEQINQSQTGRELRQAYTPVPFTHVTIDDIFWNRRLKVNREKTIPFEYLQCKDTGRIDAFKLEWQPGQVPVPHIFWDSDVAKWIEAAAYSLATHPDPELDALLDEVIAMIAKMQMPDGYLNSHYIAVEPQNRWTNLRDNHELYCAGHLIEAAVAHYQATGKRTLLDVVRRYADHIASTFGTEPGKKRGYCGHEEIELALVKLYHATGEQRYLDLSRYFVDERGRQPHYYDQEAIARGEDPAAFWAKTYEYNQSHLPVREQDKVVGHAVRAMYLYSAMADLAAETGDAGLLAACERLWKHLTTKNMYITGGIGPSRKNEGLTHDYDLPNQTAYAETCAAVGLVFWSHRMLQIACDGQYADVMERALYNGAISGVSLDGQKFFYENPLASDGSHHRQAWFGCACCPPNLARLLASLGQYIYAQNDHDAVIHLYVQSSGELKAGEHTVKLRQETRYPWDGHVSIHVDPEQPAQFGLRLRIPGWCKNANVQINDEPVETTGKIERGYLRLERRWQPGDRVSLDLAMPVEHMHAHPDVEADAGCVALQRGPLVYCLEAVDNIVPLHRIFLPDQAELSGTFNPDLLDGVTVISGNALNAGTEDWGDTLYRAEKPEMQSCTITAIPYYAWDNRAPGAMRVWIHEQA